jgi:hypothetical protein
MDLIDTPFSREDFQAYWKKAWERASSSISGLHFGHYKAATINARLSEMHAVSVDIAIISEYSALKKWQKGLMVMLEKRRRMLFWSINSGLFY